MAWATFILALFFLSGHDDLWMVFRFRHPFPGYRNTDPGGERYVPQIVPADKLTRIGGINGSLQSVITSYRPRSGGALLFTELEYTFFIDVSTAAAAIVIMILLKVPARKSEAEAKRRLFGRPQGDLNMSLGAAFSVPIFSLAALLFFLIVPASQLTPLMVARTFGDEYWRLLRDGNLHLRRRRAGES